MKICIVGHSGSGKSTLAKNLASYYNIPVMYSDISGYFMIGVMIASIIVSLAFEVYEDFHEDGDFDFGWKYLGATVSGFFSGFTGGAGSLILYSFLGNTLDYLISGEFNSDTLGQDLVLMGISAAIGVGIGKAFKFGVSKIKTNKIRRQQDSQFRPISIDVYGNL